MFFTEPRYLDIAAAVARKYYQEFVRRGLTTGGPGEILSAPDSEAAFAMLESFVTLLEITGDSRWLEPARDLLRLGDGRVRGRKAAGLRAFSEAVEALRQGR